MPPLPIDPFIPDICALLGPGRNLVLRAEPGAGKTTRVPPAILHILHTLCHEQNIVVLQPRRLAARLAASRVAEERGERLGHSVGYQVRFEGVHSEHTRLLFVTEGLLLRRLYQSPTLPDTSVVIIDEFHERHLAADVSLSLMRHLQTTVRPDLSIVVMSATLDSDTLSEYLGQCPVVSIPGRTFPLTIEYADRADTRPLDAQVCEAVTAVLKRTEGDVLVFLPGAGEIRRCLHACRTIGDVDLRPLHGDMSLAEQRLAIEPGPRRKVIFSTNVAESSVTIEGVRSVIDSGLVRVAHVSAWSGLSRLTVERTSQASAVQRGGRAGRLGAGLVVRLYPRADFDLRAKFDIPEIRRGDMAETLLQLLTIGIDPAALPWFEAPASNALDAARVLLQRLEALNAKGQLTPQGQVMASMPLHPRLSRLVGVAEQAQAGSSARVVAAMLSQRDLLSDRQGAPGAGSGSDVVYRLERFRQAVRGGLSVDACQATGLDRTAAMQVQRLAQSLGSSRDSIHDHSDALLRSVLAAFPDRVAYRPRPDSRVVLLSGGGSAELAPQSVVQGPWLVAIDAEERPGSGRKSATLVRIASGFEVDWLYEDFIDCLRETVHVRYNASTRRVERVQRLTYDQLTVEESVRAAACGEEAAVALVDAAWKDGLPQSDGVLSIHYRYEFVRTHHAPDLPPLKEADLRLALLTLARTMTRMDELESAVERGALIRLLCPAHVSLEHLAPLNCSLPRRPRVAIHYEADRAPWIASRLQDFFGMRQGPTILGGRVPLVLHLLAPNGRDVQVTSDLSGFWMRTYPDTRRTLCRRYPRHSWPEDPLNPDLSRK